MRQRETSIAKSIVSTSGLLRPETAPSRLYETWQRNSKRKRAAKREAHKTAVSSRLSPEVVAFYKAKGTGWQTRIDETLLAIVNATR